MRERKSGTGFLVARFCLLLLLAAQAGPANAQLYKWVDDEGNTHYSDQSPEDREHTTVNTQVTPGRQSSAEPAQPDPVILPFGRSSRKIIMSKSFYRWQQADQRKLKVGIYFTGPYCTSRGAMYLSDIYTYHKGFLPGEKALPRMFKKAITNLGYDVHVAMLQDLEARMGTYQGVYLKAEIVDLELDACAPIHSTSRALEPKKISSSSFTRNRVRIEVNWKLYPHVDSSPVFETTTAGSYDSWQIRKTTYGSIGEALIVATNNLFADPQFIDLVTAEPADRQTSTQHEVPVPEAQRSEEPSWWEALIPGGKQTITELLASELTARAIIAGILSEANTIKTMSTSYFVQNNEWPTMLHHIGFNERMFEEHDSIEALKLGFDGSISLLLKAEVFGPSRVLELRPDIDAYLAGGSLSMRWDCFSNLSPQVLPDVCQSM